MAQDEASGNAAGSGGTLAQAGWRPSGGDVVRNPVGASTEDAKLREGLWASAPAGTEFQEHIAAAYAILVTPALVNTPAGAPATGAAPSYMPPGTAPSVGAHTAVAAGPPGVDVAQTVVASNACPWIAWQVPSRHVLAATPPGGQRALLKGALQRTLDANALRLSAKFMNVLLALPQPAILDALERGPAAEGEAGALLQADAASGKRRGEATAALRRAAALNRL